MSRFLICGGGTGGHLAPAVAVTQAVSGFGHEATLAVSRRSIDARLLQAYPDMDTLACPGGGFSGGLARVPGFVLGQLRGWLHAERLLSRHPFCAILAFGGFLSAGFVLAGARRGLPVLLHEANHVPGRVTRRFGRWATRVYLPPETGCPGLSAHRTVECGFPLREDFQPLPQARAREALGFPSQGPLVAVLGGSQGAAALNQWAAEAAADALRQVHLLVLTGPGKEAPASSPPAGVIHRYEPFTDQMATVLSAADCAVARAGAGTLAELARCRLPALLVPYPHAADGHQLANAQWAERRGGCRVVSQDKLDTLSGHLRAWLNRPGELQECAGRMAELDGGDSRQRLARELLELAGVSPQSEARAVKEAAAR